MGKALYRKHRPKKLSEVVGQPHVTETLERALKQGHISHAYLLTGPRGVGKTSIARILAYEVNGLPYDEEATHLDIIEIDAASNRRIDEIRELKERVGIAPTSAKYKVYIIDEVHMLTKEAFNALLKTLEEPPEHSIFILATTEAHKVPDTITSRTQRFSLKPIAAELIASHLQTIAKQEHIDIAKDAVELISLHGDGSFRDSIGLLDQLRHGRGKIERDDVERLLGQVSEELLRQLISSLAAHNIQQTSDILERLRTQGVQPAQTAHQLVKLLRISLLQSDTTLPSDQAMELLERLLYITSAPDPALALELALYHTALSQETSQPVPHTTDKPKQSTAKTKPAKQPIATAQPPEPRFTSLTADTWQAVLDALKSHHNTLYGIARMASPEFDEDKLTLRFTFAFHQKKLADVRSQQILKSTIKEVTGQLVEVVCILDKTSRAETEDLPAEASSAAHVHLETISNIFGGAEIVE